MFFFCLFFFLLFFFFFYFCFGFLLGFVLGFFVVTVVGCVLTSFDSFVKCLCLVFRLFWFLVIVGEVPSGCWSSSAVFCGFLGVFTFK